VSGKAGYALDRNVCTPAPRIPLAPAGLPLLGDGGVNGGDIGRECWVGPRITLRVHVRLGRSGAPVAAELAIRTGRKQHPVAFIQWTPTRARGYFSSICDHAGP
jgi:hypothetical protein